jgi:hypothetical protein
MALTCPKCQGEWRQYERNGVTVDQCTECRGIFLDRGELDRLIDAENSFYEQESAAPAGGQPPAQGQQPPTAPSYPPPAAPQYSPPPGAGSPPPYGAPPQSYPPAQPGYGYPSHGYHKKRKKSFLDELFD